MLMGLIKYMYMKPKSSMCKTDEDKVNFWTNNNK